LDLHWATFTADRAYTIGCPEHLSAFVLRIEDNPLNYRTGPEKSWSIAYEGWWVPFGTDEMNLGQCVQPGPPRVFPAFGYDRVLSQAWVNRPNSTGGLFNDQLPLSGESTVAGPPAMTTTRTLIIPYWFIVALAAAYPLKTAMGLCRRMRGASRAKHGLCRTCGYDLRATPGRCPECGTAALSDACRSDSSLQQ
jgi:hypothetical protein